MLSSRIFCSHSYISVLYPCHFCLFERPSLSLFPPLACRQIVTKSFAFVVGLYTWPSFFGFYFYHLTLMQGTVWYHLPKVEGINIVRNRANRLRYATVFGKLRKPIWPNWHSWWELAHDFCWRSTVLLHLFRRLSTTDFGRMKKTDLIHQCHHFQVCLRILFRIILRLKDRDDLGHYFLLFFVAILVLLGKLILVFREITRELLMCSEPVRGRKSRIRKPFRASPSAARKGPAWT